ncbi:MAG: dihydroorotase [Rectinemataceae bacterium]
MTLRFRNLRLVDADLDCVGELLVRNGVIEAVTPAGEAATADRTQSAHSTDIDARSEDGRPLLLMPAFVDLHAHFRDPGFPDKETLESGCLAAVAGGFGTVLAMANTRPATDSCALALDSRNRALRLGLVDYYPALTLTEGLGGAGTGHLDRLPAMPAQLHVSGFLALSDDGRDVDDESLMREAMQKAAAHGLLVICHCELGPAKPGQGEDPEAWYSSPAGREADRQAEIRAVERALRLAVETGCRLHLAHLSTRESLALVREAKKTFTTMRISCEVTPHHLALSEDDASALGASGKGRVNPWLRGEDDRRALLEGILDGTIDAIATDHAPHSAADKAAGAPGFSGLETAFALASEALAGIPGGTGSSDYRLISRMMSASPAAILGLGDRGKLAIGQKADLVLIDPDAGWTVDPERFRSRGKNSPVAGRRLRGRILMTIHEGRIVYEHS